jgi:hypothetical protein
MGGHAKTSDPISKSVRQHSKLIACFLPTSDATRRYRGTKRTWMFGTEEASKGVAHTHGRRVRRDGGATRASRNHRTFPCIVPQRLMQTKNIVVLKSDLMFDTRKASTSIINANGANMRDSVVNDAQITRFTQCATKQF